MSSNEDNTTAGNTNNTSNNKPSDGDIEINDALKNLGVTKFYKKGSVLTIMFGETQMLQFDVDKNKVQKTKENLEDEASSVDFDAGILAKLKFELAVNYADYLIDSGKDEDNEGRKEHQQEDKPKPAKIVLELVKQKCKKLFLDQFGTPYIAITIGDHIETLPLRQSRFRNWLNMEYHLSEDDTVGSETLSAVVNILTAKAEFENTSEIIELFVRVGVLESEPNTIYYDLTNKKCEVVKITPEGWSIISSQEAPIIFTRFSNQKMQVYPAKPNSYPADIFSQYVDLINLSKGKTPEGIAAAKPTRLMIECYIICLVFPTIPKAISMTRGEQGTAKTTGQGLMKMLIDPCTAKSLGVPESRNELIQVLSHNYIAYFDNISFLKDWIVDELCRAVTGSGNQKRRLFTDDEDVIANFMRGIGLNGINLGSARPDLIDRGLIFDFEPISDEERKLEREIWEKFEQLKPQVLAYIFDTLVKVLSLKENGGIKLQKLPRMADFTLHCEMISRCMGNEDNEFVNAFSKNIQVQTIESIASNPVAVVIMDFMKDKTEWKGTPTELHLKLQKIAFDTGINIREKSWPKASNALSRKLNEVKPSLRKANIIIDSFTEDAHKNIKTIRITKISPQSPQSPQNEKGAKTDPNQARTDINLGNDSAVIFEKSETDGRTQIEEKPIQVPNESIEPNPEHNNDSNDSNNITNNNNNSITLLQPQGKKKVEEILGKYVAWDLEFDTDKDDIITTVSFVDSEGNSEVKFLDRDFAGSEIEFLNYIMAKLLDYHWSIGWNTQGNSMTSGSTDFFDLSIIHKRCKVNGINSIVELNKNGTPYLRGVGGGEWDDRLRHIDLINVYSKIMVQDGMYHNKYRTFKLDDVSKTLLGYGKYNDYTGEQFHSLPIEEKEAYSLMDSKLVMELSKYNNFEVLDAMYAISEITKLDFERVCKTNIGVWWASIFDTAISNNECPKPTIEFPLSQKYKGAEVLKPKKGIYYNIVVVDAASLYPTVSIKYNLSFDKINTPCCEGNDKAKICNIFPEEFTKDCKFINPETDWICQHTTGIFPTKLKVFKAERLKQKSLGNKSKDKAFKILINGGYGLFGHPFFRSRDHTYYDPRVAELITAAGRFELSRMRNIANHEYGFDIIYGDTDSLFLNNASDKELKAFQDNFKNLHDIELEIKNKYDKLLLSAGKKHYIGYEKGEIDSVGFEGEKSDRPKLFHNVYKQLAEDIIKYEQDPLPSLRKSFSDLDLKRISPELLKVSKVLGRNPEDYEEESSQSAQIGKALGKRKKELIEYYCADKNVTGKSWTLDLAEVDFKHYKGLLWNTISEILEIAGYSLTDLASEFGIELKKNGKAKEKSKLKSKSKSKPKPKGNDNGEDEENVTHYDTRSLTNTSIGGESN